MTVWVSSDLHFCHAKVAELRGFSEVRAYNEEIIDRCNYVVRSDDIFWILGDLGVGNETEILDLAAQLNGRKQLIAGNHDPVHSAHRNARAHQKKWLAVFESVQAFAKTSICGEDFLLSHFPYEGDTDGKTEDRYTQYRLRDEGMPLLHGHTHSDHRLTSLERKIVHVGWDAWGAPAKDVQIKELLV